MFAPWDASMGQKIKGPAELLKSCFSNQEWEFLSHHKDFQSELKKGCKTLDDFEKLSTLGARIIEETQSFAPKQSVSRDRPNNGTRK
jgi:hypothetical protein